MDNEDLVSEIRSINQPVPGFRLVVVGSDTKNQELHDVSQFSATPCS
jgi:hypothetical protein